MKEYVKPLMELEEYVLSTNIANGSVGEENVFPSDP